MTKNLQNASPVSQSLLADLKNLLLSGSVNTQESIREALEKKGHVVNQSKISRLLHKIDASKSKNELGQIVYRLSPEPAPPTADVALSHLVMEIVANEICVVIKTSPGAAQLIARMIDYHKEKLSILGTIAGDDTIFVTPRSIHETKMVLMRLQDLLFIK